jgi:hypothetical protein
MARGFCSQCWGAFWCLFYVGSGHSESGFSGTRVSYRSLLTGTKTLRLDEIEKAEIKIATTVKSGPVYRLILRPESFTEKKSIVINMKVFSKADLKRVFDFLGSKLKTERTFSLTGTKREVWKDAGFEWWTKAYHSRFRGRVHNLISRDRPT